MSFLFDRIVLFYLRHKIEAKILASAIAALNKSEPLETFTIGFPEMNEFSFAKEVSGKNEPHHHELVMTNSNI